MHPELQTRLLRVLSSQEFYRVGGHRPIKSDVRIIAATNQSIEDLIKIGKFREDLYHRLNVFKLVLPPLRERKEDIASLITYFLKTYAAELNTEEKRIDDITLQYLVGFNWPGNIRQLENICRYLTVMSASSVITIDDLPDDIFKNNQEVDISKASGNWKSDLQQHIRGEIPSDKDILKKIGVEVEKILIEESLIATDGIKSEAAKLLGWGRNTLARKAKKTK
jgi:two-component system nitrogen regulation response regulator GlnG